jgi:hypothetical protein
MFAGFNKRLGLPKRFSSDNDEVLLVRWYVVAIHTTNTRAGAVPRAAESGNETSGKAGVYKTV